MKSTFKLGLFLFACTLLFITCRMEENIPDLEPLASTPNIVVHASVTGVVVDQNGEAIEEANIRIDNESLTTDRNGVFIFQNIKMNGYGTLIQIEKEGFFSIGKFIQPKEAGKSFIKIMLIPKILTGNFNASSGGVITTSEGAAVSFPANSIQSSNGTSYNGLVRVYAKWLDPTGGNLSLEMPGDLRAINTQAEVVQLATYGMIGVELEGSSGQKLQLASNQSATIEMPVPNELLSNAPATIPLWHFEETTGYWIEEGTANLQGNKYIGEVSHFSFWNCDDPYPLVEIYGKVINGETGQGIPNRLVEVYVPSLNIAATSFTDADGNFSGKVPKDEVLEISVLNDVVLCIDPLLYSTTIGPFSTDPNISILLTIPPDNNNISNVNLTGSLTKCNGDPVTNGYLIADFNNSPSYVIPILDVNGTFDFDLTFCNNNLPPSIDIYGVDGSNGYESEVLSYNIVQGQNDIEIGTVEACIEPVVIDEDFYYQIDGGSTISVFFPYAQLILNPNTNTEQLLITGTLGAGVGNPIITIDNPVLGDQNPSFMNLLINNPNTGTTCEICNDVVVTITELGEIEEAVIGSFTGTVDDNGTAITVSGAFDVIREN